MLPVPPPPTPLLTLAEREGGGGRGKSIGNDATRDGSARTVAAVERERESAARFTGSGN